MGGTGKTVLGLSNFGIHLPNRDICNNFTQKKKKKKNFYQLDIQNLVIHANLLNKSHSHHTKRHVIFAFAIWSPLLGRIVEMVIFSGMNLYLSCYISISYDTPLFIIRSKFSILATGELLLGLGFHISSSMDFWFLNISSTIAGTCSKGCEKPQLGMCIKKSYITLIPPFCSSLTFGTVLG